MSELMIKREVRRFIRSSSLEVSPKMLCSIVKIFNMRYGDVDNKHIASIASKIINEY